MELYVAINKRNSHESHLIFFHPNAFFFFLSKPKSFKLCSEPEKYQGLKIEMKSEKK